MTMPTMTRPTMTAKFITIEGTEGVGKSTNIAVIENFLTTKNIPFILTREPGGTPMAEEIRRVLLTPREELVDENAELLLMFAARAQHLSQKIKPTLAQGIWVICDRFTDATYAYQGGGRGVSLEKIEQLENFVQADLRPDATIILDAPVEIGLKRAASRGKLDRFETEKLHFFEKVRKVYLQRAKNSPSQYHIIDAWQSMEVVKAEVENVMAKLTQ